MSLHIEIIQRMLRVGWPAAVQGIFRNGAMFFVYSIVGRSEMSAVGLAALTVGDQVRRLIIMPALGFQVASVSLVGRSIGAGSLPTARRYGWETVKLGLFVLGVLNLGILAASGPMAMWFMKSPEGIDTARTALRFFAFTQFFSALAIIAGGGLAGAGDTKPGLRYTIYGQWLVGLPLAWYLLNHTSFGLTGVWAALMLGGAFQAALVVLRWSGRKWERIRV